MDPTSAVRTDTVPVMATVIAPGAFVSAPYAWAALTRAPDVRAFLDHHEAIAVAAAALLWIVCGFAIESIASYVEVYWLDRPRSDHSDFIETWWRYLRIAWDREPIGQRYLRRLLVSFKFELNMFVAALASVPGVVWLAGRGMITTLGAAGTIVVLWILAAGLFTMAKSSSAVLAEVRKQLVRGVGQPPFDAAGNPGRNAAGDRAWM